MRGSLAAIPWAISIAVGISLSDGTGWFSKPIRQASSASTTRPVNSSSFAIGHPTGMGRTQVELTQP